MAEKDIAEKTLEAYNDVFADIINPNHIMQSVQVLCARKTRRI